MPQMEKRILQTKVEIRTDQNPNEKRIAGYAAVFNQLSEVLGLWYPFREKIMPGAFKEALQLSDIRATINHNPDKVLARNLAGTLFLSEDEIGLRTEIIPPATQYANDLLVSMERGDVNQMSFVFEIDPEGDQWDESGEIPVRTIWKFSRLHDVSIVTYPAYPQTVAGVRGYEFYSDGLKPEALNEIIFKSRRGLDLTARDLEEVNRTLQVLEEIREKPGLPVSKGDNVYFLNKQLQIYEKIL